MNPSLLCTFEERNQALVAQVSARLAAICAEPLSHARFLNMLSLLEHIGSRKIMTSPAMAAAGADMLKHLAEETRHAFFFKRAAERIARRALDYGATDTVAGAAARFYMGRLDAQIAAAVGKAVPALPYLYMSLIVEFRAVWLYRLYQTILTEHEIPLTLKSVLAEEELHLAAMFAQVTTLDRQAGSRIALFAGFEEIRFESLWSRIEQECPGTRLAAE
jgi:hypothetical protein